MPQDSEIIDLMKCLRGSKDPAIVEKASRLTCELLRFLYEYGPQNGETLVGRAYAVCDTSGNYAIVGTDGVSDSEMVSAASEAFEGGSGFVSGHFILVPLMKPPSFGIKA